jgi:glycosyltransferase involved in cell wall biosynthesis
MAQAESELAKRIRQSGNQRLIPVKISNLSFLNPRKVQSLKKIFLKEEIDTIIMNLPADLKSAGLAAKKAGIPNRIYRRGSAIPIKNTFINRYLFSEVVSRVIVNSGKTAETILENNARLIDKKRIEIIYNGIDLKSYDSFKGRLYEPKEDEVVIGNLGRLSEQKCQNLLIEMAAILRQKGLKFTLLIGGTGEKDPELRQLVKNHKLDDFVRFLGFVEVSREFMNSIDIFVLTSKWEGFGYVLVEAAAAGLPVVAFDVSSNPEVVEDNRTGELVVPFDINEMANEVEILAQDRLKRIALGTAGRIMVEEKFQFDQSLEKLKNLLAQDNQSSSN